MTEVHFYVSQQAGDEALFHITRRLAQGALRRQRRVYVHCANEQQCHELDDWLWSHPAGSFLPHAQVGATTCAVMLGWQQVPADQHDMLINLSSEAPDFFSRFERVAEPVSNTEAERKTSRLRWGFYKSRGYPLQKHDI